MSKLFYDKLEGFVKLDDFLDWMWPKQTFPRLEKIGIKLGTKRIIFNWNCFVEVADGIEEKNQEIQIGKELFESNLRSFIIQHSPDHFQMPMRSWKIDLNDKVVRFVLGKKK